MERFRPATDADVDAIIAMMRCYYVEDGYHFVESDARQAVLELIRAEQFGRLWTACDEDCVIGYVALTLGFSLEYQGRDAFLDELFIAPDHRGQGMGSEAVELAIAACRELGVKAIHLEVERHRRHALEIYRRMGFEDHDRHLMTKWLIEPPDRERGLIRLGLSREAVDRDADLEEKSREQLVAEIQRLRDAIRRHRDASGHDLCWHHPELWGLLPEATDPMPTVPEWPQFLERCIRYRQSLDTQAPDAPRTTKP